MIKDEKMRAEEAAANKIRLRRLFKNPKGDWNDIEKRTKEIMVWAETLEGLTNDFIKAQKKITELCHQAYELTPKKDVLYYDSPVSPSKIELYLKEHMKKSGLTWFRDIYKYDDKMETFTQVMKSACRWLLKFKDAKDDI